MRKNINAHLHRYPRFYAKIIILGKSWSICDGFLRSLRDVKSSPYGTIKKEGSKGVYSFARFHLYVQMHVLLKYQIVRTTQKSVYGKSSIYALYRKSPINTLGDFLNLWRAQLHISPFLQKLEKWIAVCDAFFMGHLPVTFFVILLLKYFFSYYVLKKYVTEDGRRKLKN